MNGIGLLLLLAMAGQVGPGTEKDYGWEYAPDGVLQYIVQISPQKAEMMKQKSIQFPQGQPVTSEIPPELVGKIGQVKIYIGNEILPRNPSIEELRRFPRVGDTIPPSSTAQLGVPKYVEPDLIPINQSETPPSLPAFPSNGGVGNSPVSGFKDKFSRTGEPVAQPAENLVDQAKNMASALEENANDSLASAAPDPSLLAQNGGGSPSSDFLNGLRTGGNSAPPSKFQGLDKTNSNTGVNAGSLGNLASNPGMPPLPSATPSNPSNPNYNNQNLNTVNPNSATYSSSNQRDSVSNPWPGTNRQPLPNNNGLNTASTNTGNLNNFGLQQQPTPTPTFGSAPSSYGPNTQNYNPNQNPNMGNDRIASNAGLLGAQSPPNYTSTNSGQVNNGQTSPNNGFGQSTLPPIQPTRTGQTELYPQANSSLTATTNSSENVLRFSFLASLIVNVYLGFLIRKLLTRYRLLLVNTRNQMA
jgi:hypothetical protein